MSKMVMWNQKHAYQGWMILVWFNLHKSPGTKPDIMKQDDLRRSHYGNGIDFTIKGIKRSGIGAPFAHMSIKLSFSAFTSMYICLPPQMWVSLWSKMDPETKMGPRRPKYQSG